MATVMYSYRSETESNKDGTMNKVFLVLLWPLFLAPILCHAQEIKLNPNPTASDCRAAQKLLASRLTDDNSISFRELNFAALEMETCMKVDPRFGYLYSDTAHEAQSFQGAKLLAFLDRHGLYGQFITEDEQAKQRLNSAKP